ncbi:MAG TPA: hypothetical protein VFA60_13510 [Terriglobales bacterium]|nr:hypothetical protein [Terriglobales bacterium]
MRRRTIRVLVLLFVAPASATCARAQENYEIQVYPGDTVDAKRTMVELHSNFTIDGRKTVSSDGELPTNHAFHETLEITHGWNSWFETGYYLFSSASVRDGWQFVGTHIRPRVRAPEKWRWPVGVSLSTEFGYVRPNFSADTWTWELRPIVDKKAGKWYWAFNPTVEKSFRGPSQKLGWEFSPNAKVSYDVTRRIAFGLEYYGALGPIGNLDPLHEQEQQIVPTFDVDFGPNWEFNVGVGVGTTASTERLLVKTIVGYRFQRFPFPRSKK